MRAGLGARQRLSRILSLVRCSRVAKSCLGADSDRVAWSWAAELLRSPRLHPRPCAGLGTNDGIPSLSGESTPLSLLKVCNLGSRGGDHVKSAAEDYR